MRLSWRQEALLAGKGAYRFNRRAEMVAMLARPNFRILVTSILCRRRGQLCCRYVLIGRGAVLAGASSPCALTGLSRDSTRCVAREMQGGPAAKAPPFALYKHQEAVRKTHQARQAYRDGGPPDTLGFHQPRDGIQ